MEMYLGLNVLYLRKGMGISQVDLAKLVNVSHSTIHHVEKGINKPSYELLISLQQLFKVNLHELVYSNLADTVVKVEDVRPSYSSDRIVVRLEQLLTYTENKLSELENRIRAECPDCARKLNIL